MRIKFVKQGGHEWRSLAYPPWWSRENLELIAPIVDDLVSLDYATKNKSSLPSVKILVGTCGLDLIRVTFTLSWI